MNVRQTVRGSLAVTIDREAVALAGLFLLVIVPAVYISVAQPYDITRPDYGLDGAALGGAWAIAEVGFAILLLGLVLLYQRLPEWVQEWVQSTIAILVVMFLGALAFALDLFWPLFLVYVGMLFTGKFLVEYDLWWLVNDVLGLGVAILIAPLAALIFGVEALVVAMVGLAIYDWYFADRKPWMFTLGGALMRAYLPVLVIVPSRLRVNWSDVANAVGDDDTPDWLTEAEGFSDDPDEAREQLGVSMAIGVGDLVLPAMFASAVALAPSPLAIGGVPAAVLGVVGGTVLACFRMRWKILERDGGAGLPPLVTGALAGYAPFALVAWLVTVA